MALVNTGGKLRKESLTWYKDSMNEDFDLSAVCVSGKSKVDIIVGPWYSQVAH